MAFRVANALVYKKLRARLGLQSARFCFTSAAPITKEPLDFFLALNVPLLEIFGMSECSGTLPIPPILSILLILFAMHWNIPHIHFSIFVNILISALNQQLIHFPHRLFTGL